MLICIRWNIIANKLTTSTSVSFRVNLMIRSLAGLSTEYVKFSFFPRYLMTSKISPPYSFSPELVKEMVCHGGFWKKREMRNFIARIIIIIIIIRGEDSSPTWYVAIGRLIPRNPCTTCGKMTSVRFRPRVGIQDPESIKCAVFLPWMKKLPHVIAEAIRQNRHLPQTPPVPKVSSTSFVCEKKNVALWIELAKKLRKKI